MTAEWVFNQIGVAKRVGAAVLRSLLSRQLASLDRRRFTCRLEECIDETCPPDQDHFLSIHMSGRIPTATDDCDTDVRVELLDITDLAGRAEQILSVAPEWRRGNSPVFYFQTHNGVIPCQNAILAKEVLVTKIPFHLLRFARRGRRRIQVTVAILARDSGQVIVQADGAVEYVSFSDGFIEIQERREDVLHACVELGCAVALDEPVIPAVAEVIGKWIGEKTRRFTPRHDLAEPLARLNTRTEKIDMNAACERLMTMANKTDCFAAMDLAFQVAAVYPSLSCRQEELLWTIAERLQISWDRFLPMSQKRLLTPGCPFERWRLLLGIRQELPPDVMRQRLNEEYRKWNARVTNPDAGIRAQADIILSLIAEVRSRQQEMVLNA